MNRIFKRRSLRVPFGPQKFSALFGGAEGGLATTTAIIAGLFVSTYDRELVILTAVISFLVQAFNSAANRYSSERTSNEIEQSEKTSGYRTPLMDAIVQLLSHLAGAALVVSPIVFIVNVQLALLMTVSISLVLLFINGAVKAHFLKKNPLIEGLELVTIGALIISVGVISGWALK